MPQNYTTTLNHTIFGVMVASAVPPDSLSIRIKLDVGQMAKIYELAWGVETASEVGLDSLDFASLQILRDEVFDPDFAYGRAPAALQRHVIYNDLIAGRHEQFVSRQYFEPIKLRSSLSTNFLIITPAPRDNSGLGTAYTCLLTARGEICPEDNFGVGL